MAPKIALLFAIVFSLPGCGKPTASEFRDRLGKMTEEQSKADTREELIENIGRKPDEVQIDEFGETTEVWIYKFSDGNVELHVYPHEKKWHAATAAFDPKRQLPD